VTVPGGDIFAALLTETALHDHSMVTVRNRSALEAGVTTVLAEVVLTSQDLEALEDDGNAVGATPRDNELRQDQLRGSKVLDLDRRLKKLSTICINQIRACMDPEFAKKFVSCSSFIALVAQLFGKKGDGWAIHAKEATAALSKPSPLGVNVHTTLVDVANELLQNIQGRLIRLGKLKLRVESIAILNALGDLPTARAGNTMIEELMVVGETVAASESENHVADMAAALKAVVNKYGSLAKAPENFVPQQAGPPGSAIGYLVTGSPAASTAASPKKKPFEPPGVKARKVQEGSPYANAPPQHEQRERGRGQDRRTVGGPDVADRSQSRGNTVLEDAQRNQRHAVHRTARAAPAGLDVRGRQPIRADGGTTATT
jgi:hypothetical protein